MLVTSNNTNSAILTNIVGVLSQIKQTGKANVPLLIDTVSVAVDDLLGFDTLDSLEFTNFNTAEFIDLDSGSTDYTVSFYLDHALTNLLFSDTTAANPSHFSYQSGKVFYTPVDTGMNDATGVSTAKSQPVYFVHVTSSAGLDTVIQYRNALNLMFQTVKVSCTKNPTFTTNDSAAIVVPGSEDQDQIGMSSDLAFLTSTFDVYLQLPIYNWANLSEQVRIAQSQQAENLLRNGLYADRYRNGTCTTKDRNLDGTWIGNIRLLPSDALLKAVVKMKTVHFASATTY